MTAFMKGLLDNPVPPYNEPRLIIDHKAKSIWKKGILRERETNNHNGLQARNLVEPETQN